MRQARWRKYPASEAQQNFISKRYQKQRDKNDAENQDLRDFSELTKGEAANIITRLKHGAQVHMQVLLHRRLES